MVCGSQTRGDISHLYLHASNVVVAAVFVQAKLTTATTTTTTLVMELSRTRFEYEGE